MTGKEAVLGIIVIIAIFFAIVGVITFIVTKINAKRINQINTVYLSKLANTDASIQNAMEYLKLTHSITQQTNGANK